MTEGGQCLKLSISDLMNNKIIIDDKIAINNMIINYSKQQQNTRERLFNDMLGNLYC